MRDLYRRLRARWEAEGLGVDEPTPIAHGLQFEVRDGPAHGLARIYASAKKGVRLDLSQVRNGALRARLAAQSGQAATAGEAPAPARPGAAGPDAPFHDPARDLIGSDEAGKGDYFGPLVTAAVRLGADQRQAWADRGVRDSKELGPRRIRELAEAIEAELPCAVVVIGPERYNELYGSFGNLNRLLAWTHATAIAEVSAQAPCPDVLVDRFAADERVLARALREKGLDLALAQRPRAEAEPAVAAASILARAAFVRALEALARRTGLVLPLGAGEPVEQAARRIVREHGPERLRAVAKWHFKTTAKVTAG